MNNPVPVEYLSSFTQATQSLMLHLATELLGEGGRIGDFQRFAELAQVQQDYVQQMGALWLNTMMQSAAKSIQPAKGDRRFASEDWQKSPFHDFLKQFYLINARYVTRLIDRAAGDCDRPAVDVAYPVDVADFDSCKECIGRIVKEIGPVDILVNNAGIARDTTFKNMTKTDWDAVIRTNLDSVFNMTKQVIDSMVDRGWARVINVSSVNGSKGAFGQTNYSAAKAGMHGFTKALALEVARKGVTVNTISPGYIGAKIGHGHSQGGVGFENTSADSAWAPRCSRRNRRPNYYLCCNEAAFVTGANIAINGGQHMQ